GKMNIIKIKKRNVMYREKMKSVLLGMIGFLCLSVPARSIDFQNQFFNRDTAQPAYQSEIRQLAQRPKIQKALAFIQSFDNQIIANQKALTEILAPPFKEDLHGKNKYFAQLLRKYGA